MFLPTAVQADQNAAFGHVGQPDGIHRAQAGHSCVTGAAGRLTGQFPGGLFDGLAQQFNGFEVSTGPGIGVAGADAQAAVLAALCHQGRAFI